MNACFWWVLSSVLLWSWFFGAVAGVWNLGGFWWGLGFGTLLGPEESGPLPRPGGLRREVGSAGGVGWLFCASFPGWCRVVLVGVGGWGV